MSKISESLMIDVKDTISIFDKVGDGMISIDDIVNALRSLDMNPGSKDWDDTLNDFRNESITRIDAEQFASIYNEERHKRNATYQELVEGLKALDPVNGECGSVNRAILLRYLTVLGDVIEEASAEKLLSECKDKKGTHIMIDKIVKIVMGEWNPAT